MAHLFRKLTPVMVGNALMQQTAILWRGPWEHIHTFESMTSIEMQCVLNKRFKFYTGKSEEWFQVLVLSYESHI